MLTHSTAWWTSPCPIVAPRRLCLFCTVTVTANPAALLPGTQTPGFPSCFECTLYCYMPPTFCLFPSAQVISRPSASLSVHVSCLQLTVARCKTFGHLAATSFVLFALTTSTLDIFPTTWLHALTYGFTKDCRTSATPSLALYPKPHLRTTQLLVTPSLTRMPFSSGLIAPCCLRPCSDTTTYLCLSGHGWRCLLCFPRILCADLHYRWIIITTCLPPFFSLDCELLKDEGMPYNFVYPVPSTGSPNT